MISVVIPTHESERALAHTLAALVPGALDGVLREVIVADGGSKDGTAKVEGELTIKGITRPVTAAGTWIAPAADAFGNTRGHLNLEAVIDRTEFDMNWNAPLPSGGKALANEVTLTVELSLVEQQA